MRLLQPEEVLSHLHKTPQLSGFGGDHSPRALTTPRHLLPSSAALSLFYRFLPISVVAPERF